MVDGDAAPAGRDAAAGRLARFGLGVALATLVVDQVHKWWMISIYGIKLEERVFVTPFMDFVFVINKGVSYGLFTQGSQTGQYVLAGFAMVVATALAVWLVKGAHTRAAALGIGLIIGGVADFIQLHAFGFYWYVFNVADVAIVAGVVALLYDSLILSRKSAPNRT